jgi:hypothetical protein
MKREKKTLTKKNGRHRHRGREWWMLALGLPVDCQKKPPTNES